MIYEEAKALCLEFANKYNLKMTEGYGKGDDRIIEIICNEEAVQSDDFHTLDLALSKEAENVWVDPQEHRCGYVFEHFAIALYNLI